MQHIGYAMTPQAASEVLHTPGTDSIKRPWWADVEHYMWEGTVWNYLCGKFTDRHSSQFYGGNCKEMEMHAVTKWEENEKTRELKGIETKCYLCHLFSYFLAVQMYWGMGTDHDRMGTQKEHHFLRYRGLSPIPFNSARLVLSSMMNSNCLQTKKSGTHFSMPPSLDCNVPKEHSDACPILDDSLNPIWFEVHFFQSSASPVNALCTHMHTGLHLHVPICEVESICVSCLFCD